MQENSKKVYKYGVCVEDFNNEHWEFIRNLSKREYENGGWSNNNVRGWYKCRHCGEFMNKQKGNFKIQFFICPTNKCNGVKYGTRGVVLKGINDLATTHPHLTKYLVDKKDAYKYSANSGQKVKVKCIECGDIKETKLCNLTRYGAGCPVCSDGFSYPEKFVGGLLKQLGVDFKTQYSIDGRTRYDFYLPFYNCVIETHGMQHYKWGFEGIGGRTLEEEQENDRYKEKLAEENGIKHYIIIDSRESNLIWMKNSVLNTELPILLQFEECSIDWISVAINCEKSMVKEICDYFNTYGGNACNIGELFGISYLTANRYLTRGTELGWCNYTKELKRQLMCNSNKGKKTQGANIKTGELVKFNSAYEASRWLIENGITTNKHAYTSISSCCNKERKSAYGYVWSYIDEEEINNQFQANQNT